MIVAQNPTAYQGRKALPRPLLRRMVVFNVGAYRFEQAVDIVVSRIKRHQAHALSEQERQVAERVAVAILRILNYSNEDRSHTVTLRHILKLLGRCIVGCSNLCIILIKHAGSIRSACEI